MVYIDNQSIGKDVWFDDMVVDHYESDVVEEDHYYPFGLTLNTTPNTTTPTGQPYKLTTKELEQKFDLNMYDFGARIQDMQLGRWWSIDPLSTKFPNQSPYAFAGNNPVYFVDVDGLYQYPASKAKAYADAYPTLTKYLANNIQNDIRKSPVIQNAIVKNSYGGFTKSQLVNEVAEWGNKNSPTITFVEGLTKKTNGSAVGFTPDGKGFQIDAEYAKTLEGILSSKETSKSDKLAALFKFYETVLHETTHVGDLKDGNQNAPEVGTDAMNDVYHVELTQVRDSDGKLITIKVDQLDTDTQNEDLDGAKRAIERKTKGGQTEVLPTLPQ